MFSVTFGEEESVIAENHLFLVKKGKQPSVVGLPVIVRKASFGAWINRGKLKLVLMLCSEGVNSCALPLCRGVVGWLSPGPASGG